MLKRTASTRRMPLMARLREVWDRLPARERLMLSLLVYEGLTPTEAAVTIGCSARELTRVVESRLRRLRVSARRATEERRSSNRPAPAFATRRRAA